MVYTQQPQIWSNLRLFYFASFVAYGRKFIDLQDHDYLIMQCLCGDLLKDIIQLAGLFGVITADRLYSVIKKKQLFPVLDHFPFHIPASAMPVSVYCKAQ